MRLENSRKQAYTGKLSLAELRALFTDVVRARLTRYVGAGVLSFVIEYASFLAFFYILGVEVKLANIASVAISLTVNFTISKNYVFGGLGSGKVKRQFSLYLVLVAVNLTVSTLLVSTLVHDKVPGFLAKPGTSLLIATWNYIVYQRIIFVD